ncbi:catechol 2,3-dioxygenase-like lactoylglutathione lyase family enzyme [Variovorax boronicumulans]|uniref:VOC family protein n=1 Tax=Variovorax boronicumulans TaxID=436515 RepID=UPI00277F06D7|nr:VOC family protein [Variovorax boronicumulans]MDQ0070420.1 catechol 2,3-dioxygenase-like lactoylglutathione lyase family enzyme [Variovorax boronicumulans]
MFAHIQIGVKDLGRMCAFYDAVLAHFGLQRSVDPSRTGPAGIYWQHPGQRWPQFVIGTPVNGQAPSRGNGSQVSFLAPSRSVVDAVWATALAHGATDQGAPGLRPRYAPDFYAAYCLDPEGHKLCFVHTIVQVPV